MEAEKHCRINWKYFPIKAHYFFLFGSMGGTIPFMQVLGKDLGISATAVGLIFTVAPFCVFLSKLIFGFITDLFRNIKLILISLIIVTTIAFLAVLLIPPIHEIIEDTAKVTAGCTNDSHVLIIQSPNHKLMHLERQLTEQSKCELKSKCLKGKNYVVALNKSNNTETEKSLLLILKSQEAQNCSCFENEQNACINCESGEFQCHSPQNTDPKFVYTTYNFWLFALLSLISGSGAATSFCLTDAACYEVLGENPKLYGRQRLWATISWGITTSLTGYLNDIATGGSGQINYSPGFYLMLIFVIIDIIVLFRMQLQKANISQHICNDIGKLYSSLQTVIFSFAVYICGALTGLIWNYEFWYLTDLGASQTLLGLVVAVQCLVAEVPFFFFSEWFITKLGHFTCVIISLIAFSLRTGLYIFLSDPWLVLPIELLHGLTFAVFYTAMTSYAANFAPPGTEATMLGALGGLFEGLGVATGTLLGGLGFDKIGGKETFFVASMVSIASVLFFSAAFYFIKRSSVSFEVTNTNSKHLTTYGTNDLNLAKSSL